MKKLVYATRVYSRNFISDFGAEIKNIVGGKLTAYEQMVNKAIEKCSEELFNKYPEVQDIKMQISEFSNKAVLVTVYGVVNVK